MSSCLSSCCLYSQKKRMMIIPDNVLLSNIFIRLPAKQVAQMRSLSKTWNSLLSHPSFIQSHLHRSKGTNHEILMVFEDSIHSATIPFTEHTTSQTDVQLTHSVKVHTNSSNSPPYGTVVGSVHGLICLSDGGVKIWNPSLSAVMVLPRSSTFHLNVDNGNACHYDRRFGFDPKTNDYKVVELKYYLDLDDMTFDLLPVEVFSVRKGSWESVTQRFPSHVQKVRTMLNRNEVFEDGHNGRLHYLCSVVNDLNTIVAFDLGDETFSEIALPDGVRDSFRGKELGVLSQKLCVMSCVGDGGCEVWVMENYGVATSWVKRHVISKYDADDIVPIGFTLNSQFLFGHGIHLSLYDPESSTFRRLEGATATFRRLMINNQDPFYEGYQGRRDRVSFSTKVVQYVDSLVWVTPSKSADNDVCVSSSQIEKKQHLLDG